MTTEDAMHTEENLKTYRAEAGQLLRLARNANRRGNPSTVALIIDDASGLLEVEGLTVRTSAWLRSRHKPVHITAADKAIIEKFLEILALS
jgi:hypothetical protein